MSRRSCAPRLNVLQSRGCVSRVGCSCRCGDGRRPFELVDSFARFRDELIQIGIVVGIELERAAASTPLFLLALGPPSFASAPGSEQVASIGSLFDLTSNATPVGLKRGVALDQGLKAKSKCGVSGLLLAKCVKRTVELLPRNLRLDTLDALKPLLVEMLDARELNLGVRQHDLEFFWRHDPTVRAV